MPISNTANRLISLKSETVNAQGETVATRVNIEAVVSNEEFEQIADNPTQIKQIEASLDQIKPLLLAVCKPFKDTFQELNKEMAVEKAEIELGLNFKGEGSVYVVKATAEANFKVTLTLKPSKV